MSQYVTNPVGVFFLFLGERGRSEDYMEAMRGITGNKRPLGIVRRSLRSTFPGFFHEVDSMGMLPAWCIVGSHFCSMI